MKKFIAMLLCAVMLLSMAAFATAEEEFHIGIVTGSVSQGEDDPRGAQAFQAKYGEDMVKLAVYPDNFSEDLLVSIGFKDSIKGKSKETTLWNAGNRCPRRSPRPVTASGLRTRDGRRICCCPSFPGSFS